MSCLCRKQTVGFLSLSPFMAFHGGWVSWRVGLADFQWPASPWYPFLENSGLLYTLHCLGFCSPFRRLNAAVLQDQSADVREEAAEVLGSIPTQPLLMESMAKHLASDRSEVRQVAVELLCRNSDEDGVREVALQSLKSLHAETRQSAIRVLSCVAAGNQEAMHALQSSLCDQQMEVRQEALAALCTLGRRGTESAPSDWTS